MKSTAETGMYVDLWLAALNAKRFEEAAFHAIQGYLIARDHQEMPRQLIFLKCVFDALEGLFAMVGERTAALLSEPGVCAFCGRKVPDSELTLGAGAGICRDCAIAIAGAGPKA